MGREGSSDHRNPNHQAALSPAHVEKGTRGQTTAVAHVEQTDLHLSVPKTPSERSKCGEASDPREASGHSAHRGGSRVPKEDGQIGTERSGKVGGADRLTASTRRPHPPLAASLSTPRPATPDPTRDIRRPGARSGDEVRQPGGARRRPCPTPRAAQVAAPGSPSRGTGASSIRGSRRGSPRGADAGGLR